MIRAEAMTKIRIAGAKNVLKSVISTLYEMKLIHLVDYKSEGGFFEIGSPFSETDDYSAKLLKLRSVISHLQITGDPAIMGENNYTNAEGKFTELFLEFEGMNESHSSLKEKRNSLNQKTNDPLLALGIRPELLEEYSSLAVFKGTLKKQLNEEELKKISPGYVLYQKDFQRGFAFALFVRTSAKEKTAQFLADYGYSEQAVVEHTTLQAVAEQLTIVEKEIAGVQAKLDAFKKEHMQFFLDYEETLGERNEKAEAPLRFATSKNAFLVFGWVPTKTVKALEKRIADISGGKCFFEIMKTKVGAPVALNNPKGVKDFEFFLNLYTLPRYKEIDPTLIMFFTFPLFFGFMLGDVGYGMTLLLVFWFIRRITKSTGSKALLSALMLSSVSTIVFGFVFGELYGIQFIAHPILHRAQEINLMVMLSILIGFIHITAGFIIGFYNKYIQHGFKHALYEKGSWILLELGVIIAVVEMTGFVSLGGIGTPLGGVIALIAVAMLYKGDGVKGLIELPALLSNILSYARLFAIGLASLSLALVVNTFATNFMNQGGFMVVAAILILVLGHGINIALGVLGPFLHSLRLHYVEFFTKFYDGGGMRYMPFGAKKQ